MRSEDGAKLVGRRIRIMNRLDPLYGRYGTILQFLGDHYVVKIEDCDIDPVELVRSEFWVMRGKG